VKSVPEHPQVALPRNRKVDKRRLAGVDVRWFRLGPDDVVNGVTSRDRTVADCLRELPFDEALAVADSALRSGFSKQRLLALVRDARGQHAVRMRQVAALATADAANPFESALRAIALGVPGLSVQPQVSLHRSDGTFLGQPDLVDQRLRIVVEADSFEWHGRRAALRKDARRYNAFVVDGWLVLRFSWEDVMFHPHHVRSVLEAAVAERTALVCPCCRAAS
jgi:very-short-patch-repair endonuclease